MADLARDPDVGSRTDHRGPHHEGNGHAKPSAKPINYSILLVDDDDGIRDSFRILLKDQGHAVVTAASVDEGFQKFLDGKFDVIVTDLHMGKDNGLSLIKRVRTVDEKVGVIIMTAYPKDLIDLPESLGVWNVLAKPVGFDTLAKDIRAAAELATISPEVEAQLDDSCRTQVINMADLRKDMNNETGMFRSLRK